MLHQTAAQRCAQRCGRSRVCCRSRLALDHDINPVPCVSNFASVLLEIVRIWLVLQGSKFQIKYDKDCASYHQWAACSKWQVDRDDNLRNPFRRELRSCDQRLNETLSATNGASAAVIISLNDGREFKGRYSQPSVSQMSAREPPQRYLKIARNGSIEEIQNPNERSSSSRVSKWGDMRVGWSVE